jgi:CHAT domain-containing protein
VPDTTKAIDSAFDLSTLKSQFNRYKVLHFATHGYFDINSQEKSFLLFGGKTSTGQPQIATLQEIATWTLSNVQLVVLSACETGLSDRVGSRPGQPIGDGKEFLGLGYQFQSQGAKATLSSLWRVDDWGTQVLMSSFYKHLRTGLRTGPISVIEAIQKSQIDLITSDQPALTALNQNRWKFIDKASSSPVENQPKWQDTKHPLSHPYYWAPFILIGNGL